MVANRLLAPWRRVRAGVVLAFVGLGTSLVHYAVFFGAWAVLDGHAAFGHGTPPGWATALHAVLSFPLLWLAPSAAVGRFFGVLTVANSVLWGAAAAGLPAFVRRIGRASQRPRAA